MKQIERIHGCSPTDFWATYVLGRTPVIFTDLLSDFPHLTLEGAIAEIADVELMSAYEDPNGPPRDPRRPKTAGAWLEAARGGRAHAGSPGPSEGAFVPTAYAHRGAVADFLARLWTPLDRHVRTRFQTNVELFMGVAGAATVLHVDERASSSGLHGEIAGRKEWFLAPPETCAALAPIGREFLVRVMSMSFEERCRLAEVVGGYSFVLEPGEVLFIPIQWVHGVYYPEPALGFAEGFGRDLLSLFYSRELPGTLLRAAVVQKLYPAQQVESRYWSEFVELHDACRVEYETHRDRIDGVRKALESVYARLFPELPLAGLPFAFDRVREQEDAALLDFCANDRDMLLGAWTAVTERPHWDWWQTGPALAAATSEAT